MKSPLERVKESNVRFSPIRSPKSNSTSDRKKSPSPSSKSPIRSPKADTVKHTMTSSSQDKKESNIEDIKMQESKNAEQHTSANVETEPLTEEEKQLAREEAERIQVAKNIEHLMSTVKGLKRYYKLIDKIGEGSFSTVYKAQDLRKKYYNNDEWEPQLSSNAETAFISPTATPTRDDDPIPQSPSKLFSDYVALKHIYHTSSPKRIANEIKILRQLKDSKCISPLITAFRQEDQIFAVMPYIQHDDFKKTFSEMNLTDIKCYMRSLMTGLKHLHHFKILHRDVKPNNFLYNIRKRTGYLIDFGLAETENDCKALDQYVQKQASKSPYSSYAQSLKRSLSNDSMSSKPPTNNNIIPSKTSTSNNNTTSVLSALTNRPTIVPSFKSTLSTVKSVSTPSSTSTGHTRIRRPSRIPGYIRNDPRHTIRANRAGTKGFRAPEVLMRVTSQTCAIDIWSVGVILLCFFTGRYPFFLANEEADALIEIAQIFGYKEMQEVAAKYKRTFSSNIPLPPKRMSLEKLCQILNRKNIATWDSEEFKQGIDFLNSCLDLDYNTRITAADALKHPFLQM